MIFNFEREEELPEEKKAEKFFENQIVYDIKGNTYIFEETTKNGYLCTEIYQEQPSYYEPPEDVTGETVLLKQIYSEPPVKKKAEKVEYLEQKINQLEREITDLKHDKSLLETLTRKTPEEIITEKLKDLPNVSKFLEFLTKQKQPYKVTEQGNVCKVSRSLYFGINTEGNIRVFDPNGYECYDWDNGNFYETEEEAEKVAIKKLRYCYKELSYEALMKRKQFFEKYGEELPSDWDKVLEKKKQACIEGKKASIETKKHTIKLSENDIKSLEEDIKALEEGDFDRFLLPAPKDF